MKTLFSQLLQVERGLWNRQWSLFNAAFELCSGACLPNVTISHSSCNKHCGFTERSRCWQNDFSGNINHAVTMCAMTDGSAVKILTKRGEGKKKEGKWRVNFTESKSSNQVCPTFNPFMWWIDPHLQSCSLLWTPHPCGLRRLSENTGRLLAGRLMERRRVCVVHWPLHIASHALVLQNRLTYHM